MAKKKKDAGKSCKKKENRITVVPYFRASVVLMHNHENKKPVLYRDCN